MKNLYPPLFFFLLFLIAAFKYITGQRVLHDLIPVN